jgi:thiol-disulfide isomerase/thioredoxin
MLKTYLITFYTFCLLGCASNSQTNSTETEPIKPKVQPKKKIHLYDVESIFNAYVPDTSLRFSNPKELSQYYFFTLKKFKDFCNKVRDSVHSDSVVLWIRQAEIRFQDLTEVNYMKFYKTWKKDNLNMNMLSSFSPNSRIISVKERIDFFKTFPIDIQNNEIGKKTWVKFQEYLFDKNIGLKIHEFDDLELKADNGDKIIFKDIFKRNYKYYLLLFGASWCLPCRLEELQLKYWAHDFDTSQIKIVGLSIDRDVAKWKKYLTQDNFPWNCYLLDGEMKNKMVKALDFEGIPRNFLVDSAGKILVENTDIRKVLKAIPILNTD